MELVAEKTEAPGGSAPGSRAGEPGDGAAPVAKPASELSDADIVRGCLEGRTELFGELVRRYTNVVATYVYSRIQNRDLADEITQEAMVRAFEFLPRLKAPRSFAGWLLGIAHNTMTRALEDRSRSVPLEAALLEATAGGPDENLGQKELRSRVLTEVSRLPARYRIPLMLKYQGNYSCEQIAEFLAVPGGTVTSRLSRAYQLLFESLNAAVSGARPEPPIAGDD